MRPLFLPLFAVVSLAVQACAAPPEPKPGQQGTSCGADKLGGLVGQNISVLDSMEISAPCRIIGPDMAVTMDYSAERLNLDIDGKDRIVRIWCG